MDVSIDGTCVLLRMKQGENRINPEFVEDFHKALDRALRYACTPTARLKYNACVPPSQLRDGYMPGHNR